MTKILIAVFLGGGTGSLLRYCVQMALHERIVPYSFPWATFAVNITGSFLIGLFYALSARFNLSTEVRMLLTTGLCETRILRTVRHIYSIKYPAGHIRCIGRKHRRANFLKSQS